MERVIHYHDGTLAAFFAVLGAAVTGLAAWGALTALGWAMGWG